MRKNEAKTDARRHYGTGSHDTERFQFEPGPASVGSKVNFYGRFSPRRASRLRRFNAVVEHVKREHGEDGLRDWLAALALPGWLRRMISPTKRRVKPVQDERLGAWLHRMHKL